MRASLYLIGFAAASIVVAGLVEVGCSSSSSPAPATPEDASATDVSTTPPEDTGTPPPGDGGKACTPMFDATAASLMAPEVPGASSWTCLQTVCKTSIEACSADCNCNNDILKSLSCIQVMGGAAISTCFAPLLMSSDTNDSMLLTCLSSNTMGDAAACPALPAADSGAKDGGGGDGGGDSGGAIADAGEGG